MNILLINAFILAIIVFITLLAIFIKKKEYNNGICPKYGKKLIYQYNVRLDRYYKCENEDYGCWISYGCVDHIYK